MNDDMGTKTEAGIRPDQCILHANALEGLQKDVAQIRIAVCGDDGIGISGLVKDVKDLKKWRQSIDLRVAAVAGGVSVVLFFAKQVLFK